MISFFCVFLFSIFIMFSNMREKDSMQISCLSAISLSRLAHLCNPLFSLHISMLCEELENSKFHAGNSFSTERRLERRRSGGGGGGVEIVKFN
jgi:hypothetical protein